jgi:hypothetical protein
LWTEYRLGSQSVIDVVVKNPARAFALVNLAIFALIIAAVLWLRDTGASRTLAPAAFQDTSSSVTDTLSLGALSPDDVEVARAAQIDFITELLTDTSFTVRRAFIVQSLRHNQAYYVGAEIGGTDSLRSEMALWLMQGPPDQPRSVQAVNATAEQASIARRTASQGEDAEMARRILGQRLAASGSS